MSNVIIGIDTGVNTGFAVWDLDNREFLSIATLKIHRAMEHVLALKPQLVRVEDARKRKVLTNVGPGREQGAGSVKRDAKIWEDFLIDHKVPFQMCVPQNTKWTSEGFKRLTGYKGLTSEHARVAGVMVYDFSASQVKRILLEQEAETKRMRRK
jgi:hypothetical protein